MNNSSKNNLGFSSCSGSFENMPYGNSSLNTLAPRNSVRPKIRKKDMAKEIKKYQGRIFYYDEVAKQILPANWIQSLDDYNHYEIELHHVVPYSDWEKNTKNVREIVKENCLIAIRKIMHQHLENPLYKLSKEEFEKVYGIHPDLILYDINSLIDRTYPHIFLKNYTADCVSQSAEFLSAPVKSEISTSPILCCPARLADRKPTPATPADALLLSDEDLSCFDDIYESEVAA